MINRTRAAMRRDSGNIIFGVLFLTLAAVIISLAVISVMKHTDKKQAGQNATQSLSDVSQNAELFYEREGRYGEASDGPESFGGTRSAVSADNPINRSAFSLNEGENTGYAVFALADNGELYGTSSWGDPTSPVKLKSSPSSLPLSATDMLEYAEALNLPADVDADAYGKPVRWVSE